MNDLENNEKPVLVPSSNEKATAPLLEKVKSFYSSNRHIVLPLLALLIVAVLFLFWYGDKDGFSTPPEVTLGEDLDTLIGYATDTEVADGALLAAIATRSEASAQRIAEEVTRDSSISLKERIASVNTGIMHLKTMEELSERTAELRDIAQRFNDARAPLRTVLESLVTTYIEGSGKEEIDAYVLERLGALQTTYAEGNQNFLVKQALRRHLLDTTEAVADGDIPLALMEILDAEATLFSGGKIGNIEASAPVEIAPTSTDPVPAG